MEIAVKIIRIDRLSMEFKTKFLPREIDILTKVEHPNIVHVYKIFLYPKRIYIFMELVQRDLIRVIRQVCMTLSIWYSFHTSIINV